MTGHEANYKLTNTRSPSDISQEYYFYHSGIRLTGCCSYALFLDVFDYIYWVSQTFIRAQILHVADSNSTYRRRNKSVHV